MEQIKRFFFLNLSDYQNIGIAFPIGIFFILLTVALCAMVFAIHYYKSYTGAMYRQLIRHGATSEEKAKTLAALRLSNIRSLRSALTRGGQLTYIVKRVGEVKPTYDEYVKQRKSKRKDEQIDFQTARFYIAPEHLSKAKRLIESSSPALWKPIVLSLLFISVLVALILFLPDILSLINASLA